jgi:RNA polymerase sigma-70 factor (ECF subfamily)
VNPADAYAHTELAEVLAAAFLELTEEQRECIRLRFFAGRSLVETGAAMGKHVGAIKALQFRATQRMAGLMPAGYREAG